MVLLMIDHGKTECIERRKQLQVVLDALEKSRRSNNSFIDRS